jgi:hypothetical protein
MKFWEVIADNLSKAGWSWGCVATVDSNGQTIFVADAHRDNGTRFVVQADEMLRIKAAASLCWQSPSSSTQTEIARHRAINESGRIL